LILPIGLSYLASSIKEEQDVICWDANVSSDPMKELSHLLETFDPDVVGVSFRNVDSVFSNKKRWYYPPFVSMVRTVKVEKPDCKLIVGGPAFSIFSEEIMGKNPEIDFGVVSEGEYSFEGLLKNFDHPERVGSLVFRKDGRVVFTPRSRLVDFDDLAPPSYDAFDLAKYGRNMTAIGIQSKRGCGFGCIYCLHSFFMGESCRLRSPRKVVDEIEGLVNKHGVNAFYFVDSVFNSPLDHAREICREIKNRKLEIRWEACFRPDLVNADFVREAVRAGCMLFDYSPDGASDGAMMGLGKDLKVEDVEKTLGLISKIGDAKVSYEFMYDLPFNDSENVLGLMRLFPKIMLRCREKLRDLSLTKMRIFPHTKLYEIALQQGKISRETDLLYPTHYEGNHSRSLENLIPRFLGTSAFLYQRLCRAIEP
jgi:radical SAM superfamily enzyme YgiQ (UPF0313 family)